MGTASSTSSPPVSVACQCCWEMASAGWRGHPGLHAASEAFSKSVLVADLNGDGKLDVVDVNGQDVSVIYLILADGTGGFGAASSYAAGPSSSSVTAVDVNGDGNADLIVADQTGGVYVLRGDGIGGFGTAITYAAGPSFPVCYGVGCNRRRQCRSRRSGSDRRNLCAARRWHRRVRRSQHLRHGVIPAIPFVGYNSENEWGR